MNLATLDRNTVQPKTSKSKYAAKNQAKGILEKAVDLIDTNPREALKKINFVLQLKPNLADAYYFKAQTLEAMRALPADLSQIQNKTPETVHQAIYENDQWQRNVKDEILTACDKAIELNAHCADYYLARAEFRFNHHRACLIQEIERDVLKAIELEPSRADARALLVHIKTSTANFRKQTQAFVSKQISARINFRRG